VLLFISSQEKKENQAFYEKMPMYMINKKPAIFVHKFYCVPGNPSIHGRNRKRF